MSKKTGGKRESFLAGLCCLCCCKTTIMKNEKIISKNNKKVLQNRMIRAILTLSCQSSHTEAAALKAKGFALLLWPTREWKRRVCLCWKIRRIREKIWQGKRRKGRNGCFPWQFRQRPISKFLCWDGRPCCRAGCGRLCHIGKFGGA